MQIKQDSTKYTVQFIEERDDTLWITQCGFVEKGKAIKACKRLMDCGNILATRIILIEVVYEMSNM